MQFTILKRLALGYLVMMLFVICMGGYVYLKLKQLNHLIHTIARIDDLTVRDAERILDGLFNQEGYERKYLISRDRDFLEKFQETKVRFEHDMSGLERLMDTKEKRELFNETKTLYGQYISLIESEISIYLRPGDYSRMQYRGLRDRIDLVVEEIAGKIRTLIRTSQMDRYERMYTSRRISARVLRVTTVTAVLIVFVGLLISFYNTRTINRSIVALKKKTREVAKGRFVKISGIHSPPEIRELAEDFNFMCDRLEELDEMKANFISHVSHELRTPLTAIRAASEMLLEGVYADSPERQRELLAITKEECERLISSVNRILDLSRMEAKMMDYHFRESDLRDVLGKSLLKLTSLAETKKITMELETSPDLPPVKIDEESIGRVMENLIGNALKYTPEGGKIGVHARRKDNDREFVEVSVSDTGCGLSRENLEKIFDRFRRIETGQGAAGGTGLGLSIVQHIIIAHGGKIWVRSEPGKGSSFYFSLPAA